MLLLGPKAEEGGREPQDADGLSQEERQKGLPRTCNGNHSFPHPDFSRGHGSRTSGRWNQKCSLSLCLGSFVTVATGAQHPCLQLVFTKWFMKIQLNEGKYLWLSCQCTINSSCFLCTVVI